MLTEINCLSKEEFKKLGDFINSPYFNRFNTMIKLYSYLKKAHPHITSRYVSLSRLSENIFGEKKVNNLKIRKLKSDFNILFEKFILYEEVGKDNAGHNIMLLSGLRKKLLFRVYNKNLDLMNKMKKSDFGIDEMYYYNQLSYYNELYINSVYNKYENIEIYSAKRIENLSNYFIFQNLVYNYNLYSYNVRNKKPKKLPFSMLSDVFKFIETNKKLFRENFPDIATLYYANLMIITKDIKHYETLTGYYESHKNKFDYNLRTMYFLVCENFLLSNLTEDPYSKYSFKLFELRKQAFDNSHYEMFFKEGRQMPPQIFFRIFHQAVRFRDISMAENFSKQMNKFIPVEYKADALLLTGIILNFFGKKFGKVFEMLNKVNKTGTRLFIYSRLIKMMLLYETESFKALDYEIGATKKYLDRKKKKKTKAMSLIEVSYPFISSMKFLLNLRFKSETSNKKEFLKYETKFYDQEKFPEYKFWFEEKIREMEERMSRS